MDRTGRLRLVAPPRMARRRDGEKGPTESITDSQLYFLVSTVKILRGQTNLVYLTTSFSG